MKMIEKSSIYCCEEVKFVFSTPAVLIVVFGGCLLPFQLIIGVVEVTMKSPCKSNQKSRVNAWI